MRRVQALPSTVSTGVVKNPMLNLLRRRTSIKTAQRPAVAGYNRATAGYDKVSIWRETLRNINWKLIVFCVALWWFIYSAPTEGILSPHFWAASTATNSDDF